MRRAVFLELFYKWDGDLYRAHFDSVYKEDTTPMAQAQRESGDSKIMHKADYIALELMALKPRTVK